MLRWALQGNAGGSGVVSGSPLFWVSGWGLGCLAALGLAAVLASVLPELSLGLVTPHQLPDFRACWTRYRRILGSCGLWL